MSADRWWEEALCAGHPHAEWWDSGKPGERANARHNRQARAIAICRRCPAAQPCLDAAVPGLDDGVRGGVVLPAVRPSGAAGAFSGDREAWRARADRRRRAG